VAWKYGAAQVLSPESYSKKYEQLALLNIEFKANLTIENAQKILKIHHQHRNSGCQRATEGEFSRIYGLFSIQKMLRAQLLIAQAAHFFYSSF